MTQIYFKKIFKAFERSELPGYVESEQESGRLQPHGAKGKFSNHQNQVFPVTLTSD